MSRQCWSSPESRIVADALRDRRFRPHVLVVGHPYVDMWQAVKPHRLGLAGWPAIGRGTEWKRGILDHLGWTSSTQADVARGWQRILSGVRGYSDLEPELLGRVEQLIDFVTTGPSGGGSPPEPHRPPQQ